MLALITGAIAVFGAYVAFCDRVVGNDAALDRPDDRPDDRPGERTDTVEPERVA